MPRKFHADLCGDLLFFRGGSLISDQIIDRLIPSPHSPRDLPDRAAKVLQILYGIVHISPGQMAVQKFYVIVQVMKQPGIFRIQAVQTLIITIQQFRLFRFQPGDLLFRLIMAIHLKDENRKHQDYGEKIPHAQFILGKGNDRLRAKGHDADHPRHRHHRCPAKCVSPDGTARFSPPAAARSRPFRGSVSGQMERQEHQHEQADRPDGQQMLRRSGVQETQPKLILRQQKSALSGQIFRISPRRARGFLSGQAGPEGIHGLMGDAPPCEVSHAECNGKDTGYDKFPEGRCNFIEEENEQAHADLIPGYKHTRPDGQKQDFRPQDPGV